MSDPPPLKKTKTSKGTAPAVKKEAGDIDKALPSVETNEPRQETVPAVNITSVAEKQLPLATKHFNTVTLDKIPTVTGKVEWVNWVNKLIAHMQRLIETTEYSGDVGVFKQKVFYATRGFMQSYITNFKSENAAIVVAFLNSQSGALWQLAGSTFTASACFHFSPKNLPQHGNIVIAIMISYM